MIEQMEQWIYKDVNYTHYNQVVREQWEYCIAPHYYTEDKNTIKK